MLSQRPRAVRARAIVGLGLAMAVSIGLWAAAGPFDRDPLQTPAVASHLAVSTQLIGVARAGERLVAVGWRGHILTSQDAGQSWVQVAVPVGVDLTAVSFPTPEQGWAVGHSGIVLHTADGGRSWSRQLDGNTAAQAMTSYYQKAVEQGDKPSAAILEDVKRNNAGGPELPWLGVHFDDAQQGYVVGSFNTIMQTHDGGASWAPMMHLIDNPNALHLNDIAAVDGDLYIASEQGTVFRKAKGGERFVALPTGYAGTFFGIVGTGPVVLAYGLRGNVYRSTDKGDTWGKVDTGVTSAITGATVLADGRIVLVTQGGELLVGAPDGARFAQSKVSRPFLFSDVVAVSAETLAIVGSGGVAIQSIAARQP